MSDPISTPQAASSTPSDPFGGQYGAPAQSNGSTNQDGAFASVGDGSLSQLPPDPFTNPEAYGRSVPGQRLSEQLSNPFPAPVLPETTFPQQGKLLQDPEFALEERFANLPKDEQIFRTWQSRYDKTQAELMATKADVQRLARYEQFLGDVMEDDQVFESFVAERDPNLIKPKDFTTVMQTALAKEFGEDFIPDESKIRIAGTRDWLYTKKAEELYAKLSANGGDRILPLKELRAVRERAKQEEVAKATFEIEQVKTHLHWDDTQVQGFKTWADQIRVIDLANMYTSLMRSAQTRTPFVANHQGSPVAMNPTLSRIEKLFG